eukprot:6203165-Pleurochrysis_carterae.AAC.1
MRLCAIGRLRRVCLTNHPRAGSEARLPEHRHAAITTHGARHFTCSEPPFPLHRARLGLLAVEAIIGGRCRARKLSTAGCARCARAGSRSSEHLTQQQQTTQTQPLGNAIGSFTSTCRTTTIFTLRWPTNLIIVERVESRFELGSEAVQLASSSETGLTSSTMFDLQHCSVSLHEERLPVSAVPPKLRRETTFELDLLERGETQRRSLPSRTPKPQGSTVAKHIARAACAAYRQVDAITQEENLAYWFGGTSLPTAAAR